jgi:hypothetical protein
VSVEQLAGMVLAVIDKQHIRNLWNKAIAAEPLADGKYLNYVDIVQSPVLNGYQWQVGYFCPHGVIARVHIELLDSSGEFVVSSATAELEQKILSDTKFLVDFDYTRFPNGSALQSLLKNLEPNT